MSKNQPTSVSEREHPPPSLEPWLVVCLLALLPAVLILVLPHERLVSLLLPIIGSMILLFVTGTVMLWRAERERGGSHLEHRESSEAADRLGLRRPEA